MIWSRLNICVFAICAESKPSVYQNKCISKRYILIVPFKDILVVISNIQ